MDRTRSRETPAPSRSGSRRLVCPFHLRGGAAQGRAPGRPSLRSRARPGCRAEAAGRAGGPGGTRPASSPCPGARSCASSRGGSGPAEGGRPPAGPSRPKLRHGGPAGQALRGGAPRGTRARRVPAGPHLISRRNAFVSCSFVVENFRKFRQEKKKTSHHKSDYPEIARVFNSPSFIHSLIHSQ